MHIAEGFLPPLHAVAWTAASLPFVAHGSRALTRVVREQPESRLLLAGCGAFVLVLSALKLPSVSGSSSHPTGVGLGAVIFRPPVMAVLGTVVLVLQALLLAHGGLTTLGANVFAMAVVGPWAAYGCYRALARLGTEPAVFAALAAGTLATYVTTSAQLALAFPDPVGGVLASWARFLSVFALTQVPLAVVEGIVGVLLVRGLRRWALPELSALVPGVARG